jgi:hypothetical protein
MPHDAPGPDHVSVSVFCQNEATRIGACVASIAAAACGLDVHLTVIANGSRDGSLALGMAAAQAAGLPARGISLALGDKASAINQALYDLRKPASLYVHVDGYAIIGAGTLRGFIQALDTHPDARAATGIAINGRTMKLATEETLKHGNRLHGQLHALRPSFVDRLTGAGLRLPVGLYRGDGLLGSMVCHDLDAVGTPWDGHRIVGVADATYLIPQLSPWRPGDIARQFRRKIRQMRGKMENAAIGAIIYKHGYGGLPAHADEMLADWLSGGGAVPVALFDRPFMALALQQHRKAREVLFCQSMPENSYELSGYRR